MSIAYVSISGRINLHSLQQINYFKVKKLLKLSNNLILVAPS